MAHTSIYGDYVLASINPPCLFNFYLTSAAAEADKPRANNTMLTPANGYTVLTYDEYRAGERHYYLQDALTTIDERRYHEMLDILPPLHYRSQGGFHRFCMSEFQQHVYTMQYASAQGHYVCRMVDATDATTWITREEIMRHMGQEGA